MPSGGLETIESLPGLTGEAWMTRLSQACFVLHKQERSSGFEPLLFPDVIGKYSSRISYREFFKLPISMVIMPLHIDAKQQNVDCLVKLLFLFVFVSLKMLFIVLAFLYNVTSVQWIWWRKLSKLVRKVHCHELQFQRRKIQESKQYVTLKLFWFCRL